MDPRAFKAGYFAEPVVGGANLSVYLGGLGLINRNGQDWNTQFIDHLDDHRLNIRLQVYENNSLKGMHIIKADAAVGEISRVEVKMVQGVKMPASYYSNIADRRHFGFMADFSSDELHGKKIGKKITGPCRILDVKLGGGKLYTARLAQQNGRTPDLYRFDKPGNSARYIGHWAGIDNICKIGSRLEIKINDTSAAIAGVDMKFEAGRRFAVMIDNMCTQSECDSMVDFRYYYRNEINGKQGMVDETPIALVPNFGKIGPLNFKVACNAALATANDT